MTPPDPSEARVPTATAAITGAAPASHALQRLVPFAWPHRRTFAVGAALIVTHVAFSQAEPVKHILNNDGPQALCGLYHHANRVERLAICKT